MKLSKSSGTYGPFLLLFILLIFLSLATEPTMTIPMIMTFMIILLFYFLFFAYYIFASYCRDMLKSYQQKKLINSIVIIPCYEPPSNIHPAIAGYLIDKQAGKREYFATLFNAIINGHIAIDERIINNKYKYYLIKNKGFCDKNSCDRFISDYLFSNNGDIADVISFDNVSINIGERNQFTKFIISEVINLKYFLDPYKYLRVDNSDPLDPSKYVEILEHNFNSSFFTEKQKDRARKEIEYYKTCYKEYASNKKDKNLHKSRHQILREEDNFTNRPMAYTKLGAEERAKWLGFKDYLQTAERFRMDEEKVETFSKYLPYAVALGVETQWAKRFENMKVDKLEWFRSQKDEEIKRHDDHNIYFKHLIRFMGRIYSL